MPTSLVVNAGSTSHKLALLELTGQGRLPCLWQAQVDWGSQTGLLRWRWGKIHGNRTPSAFTIIMAAATGNPALRLVSLHLGGGCSASAVRGLRYQDTSMGFTPLEGLVMGSRCGSVDPAILLRQLRPHRLDMGLLLTGKLSEALETSRTRMYRQASVISLNEFNRSA